MAPKEIHTILVANYSAPGEGRIVRHTEYNTYKKMHIVGGYIQLCCEGAAGLSDLDAVITKGGAAAPWTGVGGGTPTGTSAGQILMAHIQGASNSNVAYVELDLPEGLSIVVDVGETLTWATWDNGAVKTQFAMMLYFYYE